MNTITYTYIVHVRTYAYTYVRTRVIHVSCSLRTCASWCMHGARECGLTLIYLSRNKWTRIFNCHMAYGHAHKVKVTRGLVTFDPVVAQCACSKRYPHVQAGNIKPAMTTFSDAIALRDVEATREAILWAILTITPTHQSGTTLNWIFQVIKQLQSVIP